MFTILRGEAATSGFFGNALFFFSNEPLVSWKRGQGGRSHDADDVIVVMGMAQQAESWGGGWGGLRGRGPPWTVGFT